MGGRKLQNILLLEMFLYIIAGWLVIGMWSRFVDNLFYNSLGLDRELPYHNFIVMFVVTSVFLFVVSFISQLLDEDPAGVENEQFNSGIVINQNSSPTKNGLESNGKNYQSNLDFDQAGRSQQLRETVTSIGSSKVGRRGFPDFVKSDHNDRDRLRERSKGISKNSLHRVDKILSNWDARNRRDAPFQRF